MVHNGIDLRRSPHKGTHLAVDAARAAGRRLIIAGGWTIPAELPEAIGEAGGLDPRRCRAHVERHFSAAGMVAGYQDIYRRAIGPATLPHPG
jgi:hypothetical protein